MKLKNILFPLDFSDCSRNLNVEVEYLAQRFNSDVTLLHVSEIPFTWYGCGEASMMNAECLKEYIETEKGRLKEYLIQVPESRLHRITAEGDAAWQIKECVIDSNIDLVVMGTHGYGAMRRLLLGSVAMKVLHDLSCPVWTDSQKVKFDGRGFTGVNKILCALELNHEAIPLLRFARDLADEFGASVRVIHTVPDGGPRPYGYFDTDFHRFLMNLADEDISKRQREAGTSFPVDLVDDAIGQATAALAARGQADLVVIGRGRTQAVFGTLRTHTYDIIREAPCPVLSYCMIAPETTGDGLVKPASEYEALTSR